MVQSTVQNERTIALNNLLEIASRCENNIQHLPEFQSNCLDFFKKYPFLDLSTTFEDLFVELIEAIGLCTIYGGTSILDIYIIPQLKTMNDDVLNLLLSILSDERKIKNFPTTPKVLAAYIVTSIAA